MNGESEEHYEGEDVCVCTHLKKHHIQWEGPCVMNGCPCPNFLKATPKGAAASKAASEQEGA